MVTFYRFIMGSKILKRPKSPTSEPYKERIASINDGQTAAQETAIDIPDSVLALRNPEYIESLVLIRVPNIIRNTDLKTFADLLSSYGIQKLVIQ